MVLQQETEQGDLDFKGAMAAQFHMPFYESLGPGLTQNTAFNILESAVY